MPFDATDPDADPDADVARPLPLEANAFRSPPTVTF